MCPCPMQRFYFGLLSAFMFTGLVVARASTPDAPIIVPEDFNGVVLVAPDRRSPAMVHSIGRASEEPGHAFDAHTRTQIGSASKLLTAVVALRLVERGALNLDAPVSRWLPFVATGTREPVTLRHLLSNTSGIPNGVMDSFRKDRAFTSRDIPALEAAKLWGAGEPKFAPGTDWDYSLTNWVLVRAVLEVASGKSFDALLQEELIGPLALQDTGVPGPEFPAGPDDAAAYLSLAPAQTRKNAIPPYAAASGTIFSSARDLRRLLDAVFGGGHLAAASVRELTSVQFERERYAMGARMIDLPPGEARILWAPGETSSYRAVIAYEPGSGACVVLLNNTGMGAGVLADAAKAMMRRLLDQGAAR